jgi:RNA polymerase primary sigma factor
MPHSPANPPTTLNPLAPVRDEHEADSIDGARVVAPGRLDSPIERADLSPPDTFIPESVDQLLAHSRRYPLLTPAQEIDLAQRIERGDLHAKEVLVNSNLRLVASNARRYQNQGLPLADLVQEGMLGLIRASEKFDWRKGFRFSTYATLWIRQAIQRGLENSGRTIRLPVHVAQRSRKVGRVERELSVRLGREPTIDELAQETGLPIDQVEEVRHQRAALVSLDQQVGEDGDTALGDLLPSDAEAPEETAWDNERERIVHRAISQASPPSVPPSSSSAR